IEMPAGVHVRYFELVGFIPVCPEKICNGLLIFRFNRFIDHIASGQPMSKIICRVTTHFGYGWWHVPGIFLLCLNTLNGAGGVCKPLDSGQLSRLLPELIHSLLGTPDANH